MNSVTLHCFRKSREWFNPFGVGEMIRTEQKRGVVSLLIIRWLEPLGGGGGDGEWLPKLFHSTLMKFRILSLLFKALHSQSQLPLLASPFTEPSGSPSSSPHYCLKTSSPSMLSLWHPCHFRFCCLRLLHFFLYILRHPSIAPSLSIPSSRLRLLHISLIFMELFWDFKSFLALMKGDATASLCT